MTLRSPPAVTSRSFCEVRAKQQTEEACVYIPSTPLLLPAFPPPCALLPQTGASAAVQRSRATIAVWVRVVTPGTFRQTPCNATPGLGLQLQHKHLVGVLQPGTRYKQLLLRPDGPVSAQVVAIHKDHAF